MMSNFKYLRGYLGGEGFDLFCVVLREGPGTCWWEDTKGKNILVSLRKSFLLVAQRWHGMHEQLWCLGPDTLGHDSEMNS